MVKKLSDQEYHKLKLISNSTLKKLDRSLGGHPIQFKNWEEEEVSDKEEYKEHFVLGKLIHQYILEPDNFKAPKVKRPQDSIVEVIEELVNRLGFKEYELTEEDEDLDELILDVAESCNFQSRWKKDTIVRKIKGLDSKTGKKVENPENEKYYNFLFEAKDSGAHVISENMSKSLDEAVASIRKDEISSFLLYGTEESENHVVFNEVVILWTNYLGQKCKEKVDKLIFDLDAETWHIVDLKTTGKELFHFPKQFFYLKYANQFGFYEDGISWELKENETKGMFERFKDFKPGEHYCIAIETSNNYEARTFTITRPVVVKGKENYMDLCERVKWHKEHNLWDHEKEYYANEGLYKIELFESSKEKKKSE